MKIFRALGNYISLLLHYGQHSLTMFRFTKNPLGKYGIAARRILRMTASSSSSPAHRSTDEEKVREKLKELEDQGQVVVKGGLIFHPKGEPQTPQQVEYLERSVAKTLKEIDPETVEEKTDVFKTRLAKPGGVFSWRNTWLYRLKVYLENIYYFYTNEIGRSLIKTSGLAERFLEWETTLQLKHASSEVREYLGRYIEEVNTIQSATILKKASFGTANRDPLGSEPVFILSDLHLSTGTRFDRFNKAAKLIRLLKIIQKMNGTLIINGDFFDFWQANPRRVFTKYKEILWEVIRLRRVILIPGNHDAWLMNFEGQRFLMPNISVMQYYYDPTHNLYIEHGHLGDPINRIPLGRILSTIAVTIERVSRIQLAEQLENTIRMLTPRRLWFDNQVEGYVRRMAQIYYEELGLKPEQGHLPNLSIVFGHIHYTEYLHTIALIKDECARKLPEVTFYSSGHWTDSNPIFLCKVDERIETVELAGGTNDYLDQLRTTPGGGK